KDHKIIKNMRDYTHYFSHTFQNLSNDVPNMILEELRTLIIRVKRARKWHLVNKLTRAFAEACLLIKLKTVRSITLMKAIIKTIKELKEIISEEAKLVKIGLNEAWKISELASKWGHKSSKNWRNNKYFIVWQALTLKWISRLFGGFVY
ncbi:MAG: hypothetical protein QXS74_08990, partial [Nitrososphaeria archaeon]